ncbi:MAG: hypothetical protein ACRDO4_08580 [Nocardioides sp.]
MTATAPEPQLAGLDLLERWLAHRDACLQVAAEAPEAQPVRSNQ